MPGLFLPGGKIGSMSDLIPGRKRILGGDEGNSPDEDGLELLKKDLGSIDLDEAASRCGGRVDGSILRLKILGKDFGVDLQGAFYSNIHVISWVTAPFLMYVVNGAGKENEGRWISLREMKGGGNATRYSKKERKMIYVQLLILFRNFSVI